MRSLNFIVFFSLTLCLNTHSFAQEQPSLRERANEYFRRHEYSYAATIYEKLVNSSSNPRLNDLVMAAESYMKMGNYALALNYYSKVYARPDHNLEHVLKYAELLKINGHFERAKNAYKLYADSSGNFKAIANKIAGCDSALFWLSKPNGMIVRNQEKINTANSEFGVVIWEGQYYFIGEPKDVVERALRHSWTGRPFVKIFNAQPGDSGFESATLAGYKWNHDSFHLGPIASPDNGRTIYVTQNFNGQYFENRTVENRRVYLTYRLEIQVYEREGELWKKTSFSHNNPRSYSVAHPAFSRDGRVMYFVSDMPGGHGGLDIWYCVRLANGKWGEPKNAGPTINTLGNELFPHIGADDKLYFSSDGWIGMGGLDIYQAEGTLGQWTKSVNLGSPINSSWDDFSFVLLERSDTRKFGFLSSNRPGGKGEDDIYSFEWTRATAISSEAKR